MGIIHIPRVIAAIARGQYRRRRLVQKLQLQDNNNESNTTANQRHVYNQDFVGSGFGLSNPHVYNGRCGILDIDIFGHMNNASYLSHAEYARWDCTAYNGLMETMLSTRTMFIVASSSIKYRREIKPIFKQFDIHTYIAGLDPRNIWLYQTFRYPPSSASSAASSSAAVDNKTTTASTNTTHTNRILAQVLIRGAAVQKGKVIDPRQFLIDNNFDPEWVHSLNYDYHGGRSDDRSADDDGSDKDNEDPYYMEELFRKFEDLDTALKLSASVDDEIIIKSSKN